MKCLIRRNTCFVRRQRRADTGRRHAWRVDSDSDQTEREQDRTRTFPPTLLATR